MDLEIVDELTFLKKESKEFNELKIRKHSDYISTNGGCFYGQFGCSHTEKIKTVFKSFLPFDKERIQDFLFRFIKNKSIIDLNLSYDDSNNESYTKIPELYHDRDIFKKNVHVYPIDSWQVAFTLNRLLQGFDNCYSSTLNNLNESERFSMIQEFMELVFNPLNEYINLKYTSWEPNVREDNFVILNLTNGVITTFASFDND